jgi:hypothetical protein
MATFYVLPPRPLVRDQFAGILANLLPGVPQPHALAQAWLDTLADVMATPSTGYVLHREDVPTDITLGQALVEGYGAEAGDTIVEVRALGGRFQERRQLVPQT